MPGGLLNLVAYGNQNQILTGNPSKTFFKCTYAKYTNFGLQRFRLDFDGQRSLRMSQPSVLRFKVPRYGDLLMDTYLVVTMPTIWSTIIPPQSFPTKVQETSATQEPVVQESVNVWSPYEFKWIKNLGTQMIKEVKFMVGGQVIQKFTGDYLYAMVERDFDKAKKDLYYKMTGNVPEMNDPANAFGRNNSYPNAWPTNSPNYINLGPEPSIRSRKLYIPLNIWFTLASKMAFPLVSLQYNEFHMEITLRPVQELFVIRDVENVIPDIRPTNGVPIGNYIQPNFNNQLHQMYRFLQPPPDPQVNPNDTTYHRLQDIVKPDYYVDQRTNWAADIHIVSTYAFLSDEEVKVFALQPQNYLIKEFYQYEFKNVVGTQRVSLETSGLVANWMWYLQRTDAFLRNEWSNYTNWPYDTLPNNLIDPLDYVNIPDNSTPVITGEYYDEINFSFTNNKPSDSDNKQHEELMILEGIYKIITKISKLDQERNRWTVPPKFYNSDNDMTITEYLYEDEDGSEYKRYTLLNNSNQIVNIEYDKEKELHYITVESNDENIPDTLYDIIIAPGKLVKAYTPPAPIARSIKLPNVIQNYNYSKKPPSGQYNSDSCVDVSVGDSYQSETKQTQYATGSTVPDINDANCCDNWWNIPITYKNAGTCYTNPSYNPWFVKTETIKEGVNNVQRDINYIYPNAPYYKTDLKITGDFHSGNVKDIMITWALIMDGKYRETELDAGILNYVEKYARSSGDAPDGLYCYNFGLQSSPFIFQPSGAINLTKFKTIEFEVSTYAPPSDPNAETLTICDSDGNIVGVNKPVWRVYDYTYNLVVMEERYNVLKFISGNAALAYAR